MRRALIPLALLLTSGCTTVGHERVEGWPELAIVEHRVSASQMYSRCRKYVGFGMVPMACAEFNLATRRCDVWLVDGFALPTIVEHERLHCRGYDHVGETSMRDFLTRYQAYQASVGASTGPVIAPEAAE
ncbi:MAG: hypothetical protein ACT4P3_08015 [Betaproteobacteria bacterium]